MFRCVVVALFLACSLALDLDAEWSEFKRYHQKSFDVTEDPVRRAIWEANLDLIQRHNLEADRGEHSYWLGMNKFGDMTDEEVTQMLSCLDMDLTSETEGETFHPPDDVKLPNSVDWRKKGGVTPVKDQGSCGSCWAFSATGSLEGQKYIQTGKLVSLSEQNLIDCSRPQGNNGCKGGGRRKAFKYIQKYGINSGASYPYEARDDRPCRFKPKDVEAKCSGYTKLPKGNEDALQTAVATVGPISVSLHAPSPTFLLYRSGVYYDFDCKGLQRNHAVLVVGYDNGAGQGKAHWIVKNSWGPNWGDHGYANIAKDRGNVCGIADSAIYPTYMDSSARESGGHSPAEL